MMGNKSRTIIVINEIVKPRGRGRPRKFNTEEVIRRAALVFWEQGFEGTSVEDLTVAMGITMQSLYAAFGSKAELYKQALTWYQQEIGVLARRPFAEEPDVSKAIERSIRKLAAVFTRSDLPHGCMRSTAMIRYSLQHEEIAGYAASLRAETAQAIKGRLDEGIRDGQLVRSTNTIALAAFINALIVGMSVAAKDGASEADLLPFAGMAVASLESSRSM